MNDKLKILFLCTGNSCRSQMAEGWARELRKEDIEPYSAGIEPRAVDPRAIQAMAEAGVDISGRRSKHMNEFKDVQFDLVITLCDHARQTCPVFLGKARIIHRSFQDPQELAANAKTRDEAMAYYRKVRDEIKEFVRGLPPKIPDDELKLIMEKEDG